MSVPVRRAPPAFRRLAVRRIDDLTPRMRRFVLGGPELEGFYDWLKENDYTSPLYPTGK